MRKRGTHRWQRSADNTGNWYRLPELQEVGAASEHNNSQLEALENNKERVRILLARYGIIFRELLHKEAKLFRWGAIFKALRLMELSREITSGYFFKELPGPQFITHEALGLLKKPMPEQQIFWLNACDPISLCGLPLITPDLSFKASLPKRLESTHLVYRGSELVLVSLSLGKHLQFNMAADDPQLPGCLKVLHHLLNRSRKPLSKIIVETINDESALQSRYLDCLQAEFDLYHDHKQVILQNAVDR